MRVPPTGGAANKIESAPRTTYTTWQFTLCEWGYERYDFWVGQCKAENPLAPSHLVHFQFPFSDNWPSGVIRIGLPVWNWKNFQNKRGLMRCKWSSLNAPGTENPLSHPVLELDNWPSGVIRIGLPVWKWKRWKISWTIVAHLAANGSVWMP